MDIPETPTTSDDEALVAALRARDESALIELYARYRDLLLGAIMKVTHNLPESEDVLQETIIQVWERIESFDPSRGKLASWLFVVARRRAIDRIRRVCAYQRATDRFEVANRREFSNSRKRDAHEVVAADLRATIDRALARLPRFQREAISLSLLDGKSQREIAALTRTPLGTVKTRIELGKKKLVLSIAGMRDDIQ